MSAFVANFVTKGFALTKGFLPKISSSRDPSTTAIEWPMVSKEKPFLHMEVDLAPSIREEDFTLRGLNFWTQMVAEFPEWDVVMGRPAKGNWAQMAKPGNFWLPLLLTALAFSLLL